MADLTSGAGCCEEGSGPAAQKMSGQYDHDRISLHDLMELGITAADFGPCDVAPAVSGDQTGVAADGLEPPLGPKRMLPAAGTPRETAAPVDTGTPPLVARGSEYAVQDAQGTVPDSGTPAVVREAVTRLLPDSGKGYAFEVLDPDEEDAPPHPDDPLDQLWYLEVPEADDEEVIHEVSQTSVSSDQRAMQLALDFLRSEGLYSERNLDFLADIIRQRGWRSVQFQVRGLIQAGYGVAEIHRMFQFTDAWLHCVESDTLAPERWHGGKRLTWLEAAHLLDFLGHEAELEQVADFLSLEQEVWYGLRRESGHLATFKNYLFEYRLSPKTQVEDGIWQCNLDPGDARSFDGTRNPLYLSSWWDEPTDCGVRNVRQMVGAISDPARIAEWLSPDTEGVF